VSINIKITKKEKEMKTIATTQQYNWFFRSRIGIIFSGLLFLIILQACTGVPISSYDSTTYTQLTALKAETTLLVESFDTKPVGENENKIDKTILNLRKAYEYERGKGKSNSDTTKQFEKIIGLFSEDVKDFRDSGPKELGEKYFQQAAIALGQAFDIVISTENLKNKK
jgi:hypothetical protein